MLYTVKGRYALDLWHPANLLYQICKHEKQNEVENFFKNLTARSEFFCRFLLYLVTPKCHRKLQRVLSCNVASQDYASDAMYIRVHTP